MTYSSDVRSIALLLFLLPSGAQAAEGDWPMWRHDNLLTAYQRIPGSMGKEPRILGKHFIGAGHGAIAVADLRGTGHDAEILVAARGHLYAYTESGRQLWEFRPQGYVVSQVQWVDDLDGDGHREVVVLAGHMGGTRQAYLVIEGTTGRQKAAIEISTGDFGWKGNLGKFLPGRPGKQIFLVTSMRQAAAEPPAELAPSGAPRTPTQGSNGQFWLWSFDGKSARQHWTWAPQEHPVKYAEVMIADLPGDGRLKGIVSSWCHVWNIDLASGELVSHTTWNPNGANQRHYGFNRLVDVDGDGRLDFVNLALTKHIDVLTNQGGKLVHTWTHAWPDTVTTETRSLRWPGEPVVDLDGDGKLEIVAAVFDGQTDKRWHLGIWDAATGRSKLQCLDLVPVATTSLGAPREGAAILCYRSRTINADPPEAYEVWQFRDGKLKSLWSSTGAGFLLEPRGSATGDRAMAARTSDVDGDGRVEFFTTNKVGGTGPQAWGLDAKGSIIAKPGQLAVPKSRPIPSSLPAFQGTIVPYLLAADLYAERRNELLLYDNAQATVLRFIAGKLAVVETIPSTEIPVVCDLIGDGKPYLLTAGRGADGNLWIQARGPDKKNIWRFVFPDSSACGQYSQRPHYFTVGHFTGGKHLDVFSYSTKPAARTYVLDGRTGKPVWERREIPRIERHSQAFGGRASVWDFNGDGADDVIFCNPDYYCIADGRTGNLLVGPVEIAQLVKWWAAYSSPAVLRQDGQPPLVYLGGAYSARASISLDGRKGLWREYLPTDRWPLQVGGERFSEGLLPPSPNHGDKKNHRGWRGLQVEADGTLVCFDAATGRTFWRMPLGSAAIGIISGDVDGDGEPEALVGTHDGALMAIREGGDRSQVVWTKRFCAPIGTALLADLDGDGRSEIVLSVGDGNICVLGK